MPTALDFTNPTRIKCRLGVHITHSHAMEENQNQTTAGATVETLDGLDAIQSLVASPITITFAIAGKQCSLKARRLMPFESEMLRLQLEAAFPPLIKGKQEADDRLDVYDAKYRSTKLTVERAVRAQAIFWCVPDVQKRAPELAATMHNPASRQAICDMVNGSAARPGVLTDELLELIYARLTSTEASVGELVNFT